MSEITGGDALNARSFVSTVLSVISANRRMYGVTVLNSELFVTCGESQLYVYNTDNYTLARYITIGGSEVVVQ